MSKPQLALELSGQREEIRARLSSSAIVLNVILGCRWIIHRRVVGTQAEFSGVGGLSHGLGRVGVYDRSSRCR